MTADDFKSLHHLLRQGTKISEYLVNKKDIHSLVKLCATLTDVLNRIYNKTSFSNPPEREINSAACRREIYETILKLIHTDTNILGQINFFFETAFKNLPIEYEDIGKYVIQTGIDFLKFNRNSIPSSLIMLFLTTIKSFTDSIDTIQEKFFDIMDCCLLTSH